MQNRIRGAERGDPRRVWCVHSCELAIRKPAPEWAGKAVVKDAIVDLSSASLKGKWVVLFFYPLDFTFVCPTEIVEFNNKWVFSIRPRVPWPSPVLRGPRLCVRASKNLHVSASRCCPAPCVQVRGIQEAQRRGRRCQRRLGPRPPCLVRASRCAAFLRAPPKHAPRETSAQCRCSVGAI